VDAHPPVRISSAGRQDGLPDARPLPVRTDQEVELTGRAVGEVGDHSLLVLLELVHAQAEDVVHVLLRRIVEDAHQVTAHDLVLGRRSLSALARGVGHDRRPRLAAGIHECDAGFVHEAVPDDVE